MTSAQLTISGINTIHFHHSEAPLNDYCAFQSGQSRSFIFSNLSRDSASGEGSQPGTAAAESSAAATDDDGVRVVLGRRCC